MKHYVKVYGKDGLINEHVFTGTKPSEAKVREVVESYPAGEYATVESRVYKTQSEGELN
jgi:hypothetical protein